MRGTASDQQPPPDDTIRDSSGNGIHHPSPDRRKNHPLDRDVTTANEKLPKSDYDLQLDESMFRRPSCENLCNGCGAEPQEFYGCSVCRVCAPSTYRAVERLTSENDFMKSNRKSQRVKHFLGLVDSGSNCNVVTEEFFLDEAEVQATPIGGVAGKAKSKLKGKVRAWVRGKNQDIVQNKK